MWVEHWKRGGVEGMEGKLKGNYQRLVPELCLEDNNIQYSRFNFQHVIVIHTGEYPQPVATAMVPAGVFWPCVGSFTAL